MICKAKPEPKITVEEFDRVFVEAIPLLHHVLWHDYGVSRQDERCDIIHTLYLQRDSLIARYNGIGRWDRFLAACLKWSVKLYLSWREKAPVRYCDPMDRDNAGLFTCSDTREETAPPDERIDRILSAARYPDILRMYFLNGWTQKEIGQELGLAACTIGLRMQLDVCNVMRKLGIKNVGQWRKKRGVDSNKKRYLRKGGVTCPTR